MERKIGERFLDNGVELEVVGQDGCFECYYYVGHPIYDCVRRTRIGGICNMHFRTDKKPIIFKEVEK